ncbi:hypothetical protein SS50377_20458 [Spironucleus salmonicida]|uniref:Uncharacterized protein n=1 Tax=Spironucleus salmonicida TaxID=348837 RepID=A0A9P8M007_9EUKA|nr:hypothetical protein SS50377_20458 [Spironucleus salmonicida]
MDRISSFDVAHLIKSLPKLESIKEVTENQYFARCKHLVRYSQLSAYEQTSEISETETSNFQFGDQSFSELIEVFESHFATVLKP